MWEDQCREEDGVGWGGGKKIDAEASRHCAAFTHTHTHTLRITHTLGRKNHRVWLSPQTATAGQDRGREKGHPEGGICLRATVPLSSQEFLCFRGESLKDTSSKTSGREEQQGQEQGRALPPPGGRCHGRPLLLLMKNKKPGDNRREVRATRWHTETGAKPPQIRVHPSTWWQGSTTTCVVSGAACVWVRSWCVALQCGFCTWPYAA